MRHESAASSWVTALKCRCPRCRKGALFNGFLTVADSCPSCALPLRRADSGDGPAVFLIFLLGFVVVPPIILIGMDLDWPLWLHGIVWSIVILGLTLGMIRPAKAGLIALQYHTRPETFTNPGNKLNQS